MLQSGGVQPIRLPPRSPNLNAFAERCVRSIKHECLSKLILFGEPSLKRTIKEYCSIITTNATIKAKPICCSSLPRTLHLHALGTTSFVSSA